MMLKADRSDLVFRHHQHTFPKTFAIPARRPAGERRAFASSTFFVVGAAQLLPAMFGERIALAHERRGDVKLVPKEVGVEHRFADGAARIAAIIASVRSISGGAITLSAPTSRRICSAAGIAILRM